MIEMSGRNGVGRPGKGALATVQGKKAACSRKPVHRKGRRQGPMELFRHNKYSVGHHEYSIRWRFADRPLRELELTGGLTSF